MASSMGDPQLKMNMPDPAPSISEEERRSLAKELVRLQYYGSAQKNWAPSTLPDFEAEAWSEFIAKDKKVLEYFESLQICQKVDDPDILSSPYSTRTLVPVTNVKPPRESVWTYFTRWIEEANQNGNVNAPVLVRARPELSNRQVLQERNPSGYSNDAAGLRYPTSRPERPEKPQMNKRGGKGKKTAASRHDESKHVSS